MKYEFIVYPMEANGHCFWAAESRTLDGCAGQGETPEEAIRELEQNEISWLESAEKYNLPIPEVTHRQEKTYSGKVLFRFSPMEHQRAYEYSREMGISLNQYLSDAVTAYNAEYAARHTRPPKLLRFNRQKEQQN